MNNVHYNKLLDEFDSWRINFYNLCEKRRPKFRCPLCGKFPTLTNEAVFFGCDCGDWVKVLGENGKASEWWLQHEGKWNSYDLLTDTLKLVR